MISNEIKMRVAQNCSQYISRSIYALQSVVASNQSCNTCQNYIRGNCTKDIFDEIYENIRKN